jgi:tryptophan synthase alpha chain
MDLALAAAEAGATAVEIGVPFSDPIADGPVIQRSSQVALAGGVTLKRILESVAALRRKTACPLVLMGYANVFMRYGFERLAADAAAAGVDGLIIPDLPPEEAETPLTPARAAGLSTIFLVAQTSREARVKLLCQASTGFVYYVARLGVTGASKGLSPLLAARIAAIREHTDLPVAAGFGISTPEQVRAVTAHADAAIMGSALIRIVADHNGPGNAAPAVASLVSRCVAAARL